MLIRVGSGVHVFSLCLHHVVFDEWSAGILFRELAVLYEAFRGGEPARLEPLSWQYADFAFWQREWVAGEAAAGELAYWREQLAGAPAVELPATGRGRRCVQRLAG